jgi:hypothetical protein
MHPHRSRTLRSDRAATRLLAVVDWTLEPAAVVSDLRRHAQTRKTTFGLLVPAWLHGLDWVGDPTASEPCAERQLAALRQLTDLAGVPVETASVGDPDLGAAACDMLEAWPAEEIVLYTREGQHIVVPWPFGPASRIARASGLPVSRVAVREKESLARARRWFARRRNGHCALPQAHLA